MAVLAGKQPESAGAGEENSIAVAPILKLIGDDLATVNQNLETTEDAIIELMDVVAPEIEAGDGDLY